MPAEQQAAAGALEPLPTVDVLVAGLGPGGCAAALAARAEGLHTLAVEARGPQATRSQLVLVRPGAQAALRQLGLPDITEGRRTTTIRHVENRLRAALVARVQAEAGSQAALCWHTSVVDLQPGAERVVVTLRDEASGATRQVAARHVIDASGGRLEALGRPARERAGPRHVVSTAEYSTPPWFEGIVGVRDPGTHELFLLFPTWGRRGVIAYFDAPTGPQPQAEQVVQRFGAVAERLGLGTPNEPLWAVDVYQRVLRRPNAGRVLPIGDAVGTVDVLLGAGMSTAIEDGADAARSVAAACREASVQGALERLDAASRMLHRRHRASALRGRLLLAARPLVECAWPRAPLPEVAREQLGPPPLLWPAVRFLFGRRPSTP
jgi:2-polyprenyl-6-methoxyphenol hydroxylase-like FAD-dependent oxidoreductase